MACCVDRGKLMEMATPGAKYMMPAQCSKTDPLADLAFRFVMLRSVVLNNNPTDSGRLAASLGSSYVGALLVCSFFSYGFFFGPGRMRCAGPQFRSDVALHDVSWVRKCELLARGEGRLQQRAEGAQPSNGLGRRGNYAVALAGAGELDASDWFEPRFARACLRCPPFMCRLGVWATARRSQARSSVGGWGVRLRVLLRLQLRDLESLPGFQDGPGCDGKGATLKERLVAAFLPGASQSAASILTKHGVAYPSSREPGRRSLLVLGCEIGSRVRSTLPACPACGYQRVAWTTMAGCPNRARATAPSRLPRRT